MARAESGETIINQPSDTSSMEPLVDSVLTKSPDLEAASPLRRLGTQLKEAAGSIVHILTPTTELGFAGVGRIESQEKKESESDLSEQRNYYRQLPPQRGRISHGNSPLPPPIRLYPKPPRHKRFHGLRHMWWKVLGDPAKVAEDVVLNADDRDNGLRIKRFITHEAKDVTMDDRALLKDAFVNLARSKAILSGGKYALKAIRHTTEETASNTILRSIPFVQLVSTLIHTRFIDGVKENNKLSALLTVTDFLGFSLPAITTFAIPIPFVGTSIGVALSPSFYLDLWASISANAHLRETTDNIGEYIKQVLANTDSRLYYPRVALAQRIMEAAQKHPEYFNNLHRAMDDLNPNFHTPNNPKHQALIDSNRRYQTSISMLENWLAQRKRKNWLKRLWTIDDRILVESKLDQYKRQKYKLIDQPFQEAQDMYIVWKLTREVLRQHQIYLARGQLN